MNYQDTLRKCQKVSQLLKRIIKAKDRHDTKFIKLLKDTLAAARELFQEELPAVLENHLRELEARREKLLQKRRESLLSAAQESGMPYKRFDRFDRIGPFKVSYREKKVILELGSEKLREIEEVDGSSLLNVIKESHKSLEETPFERGEFFRLLKYAYYLVRQKEQPRDGWVPIKELYSCFVLTRNLVNRDFMTRPGSKHFQDYSTAQFVYDLARFGREGWIFEGERLETRTPSMREVPKAMILPALESVEQTGPQIAHLRIVRVQEV